MLSKIELYIHVPIVSERRPMMQFPQIRMQSQMAQVEIHTKDAKQHIQQPKAEITIQQPPAEISIRTKPGKLTIDQTQAFADMNLIPILQWNDQNAEKGNRAIIEGIGRRAREGRELMEIENGNSALTEQAKRRSTREMKALGITFIPSHFSVKTNYEPAEVEIDVQQNRPIFEAETYQRAILDYEPWSVETMLKQRAELDISFVNITV